MTELSDIVKIMEDYGIEDFGEAQKIRHIIVDQFTDELLYFDEVYDEISEYLKCL